jgi:hypothetical protein
MLKICLKAVNHRDRNFTSGKMKTRMVLIEQSIVGYLEQLDRMDRHETPSNPRQTARLKERIATTQSERGDEPACPGVQPETSDEDHGDRAPDRLIPVQIIVWQVADRPQTRLVDLLRGELSHGLGPERTMNLS